VSSYILLAINQAIADNYLGYFWLVFTWMCSYVRALVWYRSILRSHTTPIPSKPIHYSNRYLRRHHYLKSLAALNCRRAKRWFKLAKRSHKRWFKLAKTSDKRRCLYKNIHKSTGSIHFVARDDPVTASLNQYTIFITG
jgi:hypothetical protein